MTNLLAVALVAGLWLAIKALWCPPWMEWVADRLTRMEFPDDGDQPGSTEYGPGEADQPAIEWELHTQQFIRRRLDALVEELERLDSEPDIFAKAFHTMVARSAHDALLADASRLAHQPPRWAGQTLDVELIRPSTGRREELEL